MIGAFLIFLFSESSAQVINNEGAVISISSNTVVVSDVLINSADSIINNGIIELESDFDNQGITVSDGTFRIKGNWINTGTFNPGTGRVEFRGDNLQTISSTGGENFYSLYINKQNSALANRVVLNNQVTISDTLNLNFGIVDPLTNTLFLTNLNSGSLLYNQGSESRIIGKFERGVGNAENYLFPVGTGAFYNPLNMKPLNIPVSGSVLSEFISSDPGIGGLPIPDDYVEIYSVIKDGYWSLTSTGFSSDLFNMDMDGKGFSDTIPVQTTSRIIKRQSGGPWEVDGRFKPAVGTVAQRDSLVNDITGAPYHFAFGNPRPRIVEQPRDTAVCDLTDAFFRVIALGDDPIRYEWELNDGTGWITLSNGVIYSGTRERTLLISPADTSMDGYQYRVKVYHLYDHYKYSDIVTLTVDPIPNASATPPRDTICNNGTANITLTSDVPGTDFFLDVFYDGSIVGADTTLTGGNLVSQDLYNPLNFVDSVIYIVTPRGPGPTSCYGHTDQSTVLVNPTPNISATVPDTLYCNDSEVLFTVTNTQGTTGTIIYDLNLFGNTSDFIGENPASVGLSLGYNLRDTLSHANDSIRSLYYRFTPYIENAFGTTNCYDGVEDTVLVKMVPVITALAEPDTLSNIGGNPITCFGFSDGDATLTTTGGDYRSDYNFVWKDSLLDTLQNVDANPTDLLLDQPAGIYYYTIVDIIGCEVSGSFELTQPDPIAATDSVGQPLCAKSPTGSIDLLTVSGGITNYSFYWRNLFTFEEYFTEDIGPVGSGGFKLLITDANGCEYQDLIIIEPKQELVVELEDIYEPRDPRWNLACYGDSDSYIEMRTKPETTTYPVTYKWYTSPTSLTEIWSDSLIQNLSAGSYWVEATDANGCQDPEGRVEVVVREPDPIQVTKLNSPYPSGWDISCFGYEDGELDLGYSGGMVDTLENSYMWTGPTGFTDPGEGSLDSLAAGLYTLHVEDYLGCSTDTSFTLEQPAKIRYWFSESSFIGGWNVSCAGDLNGAIDLDSINGGGTTTEAGIYSYNWTSSLTPPGYNIPDPFVENLSGLPAGEYTLFVTDQNNCPRDTTIVLSQPDSLVADTLIDRIGAPGPKNGFAIQCFGNNDGEIEISPTGGTMPYTYDWTGADVIDDLLQQQNLFAGSYSVNIVDANSCMTSYDFELNEPPQITLTQPPSYIECFGDTDTVFIQPAGGNIQVSGEYQFLWDYDASTGSMLADVVAGMYYVTVTDDNECIKYDSMVLQESMEIIPVITISDHHNGSYTSCADSSDAILQVAVTGGHPDEVYDYTWRDGSGLQIGGNSDLLENIPEGIYSLSVLDRYGCLVTRDTSFEGPLPLSVNIDYTDPYCNSISDGEISVFVNGGTALPSMGEDFDYTYIWSEPGLSGSILEGLSEGDYELTIFDLNSCRLDTVIRLIEPDLLTLDYELTDAECRDQPDGTITITNTSGGTQPYETSIDGRFGTYFDLLLPGEYLITLEDDNGCILRDTAIVMPENPTCLGIPNAFTPNGDGSNDTWVLDEDEDGSNDLVFYPDAELRIYNRWGELLYFTGNVLGEPWDGTFKGRDMPIDSYYYVLDLKNGDPPYTGDVTIIR